jgi:RNA polymerase sigma-70 factor, ECF subfamily
VDTERNKEFLALYQPCHQRLGRFVATMVWETEEAKDIVAETILTALESFEKLRSKDAFLHYLFGISIRVIRKRKRRSWRAVLMGNDGWENINEKVYAENPTHIADLYKLLATLDEKPREAIVLFEISGFSIKEIAEMQNSTLSAVKSRLVRAREALQKAGKQERKTIYLKTI